MRLYPTSIATMFATLRAVAAHPGARLPEIARFAGLGESTTTRAASSAVAIGLIRRDTTGAFFVVPAEITRAVDNETLANVMKRALIAYRPFESICEGLALGESIEDSTRKMAVLLGIRDQDAERVGIVVKWGEELGIFCRANGRVVLGVDRTSIVGAASPMLKSETVESETKARLYVATRLGRELYAALDEPNRQLLASAVADIEADPARAVERAGQAIENWLREVAAANGYGSEAKTMNGAGQLASLLVSKAVIHSHQQKLIETVSTLRNAKAHHKDKKTLVPWSITDTGAVVSLASTLVAMRSIHEFISKGAQLL
jgi:DNA-binding IclR family transcriptional regulator